MQSQRTSQWLLRHGAARACFEAPLNDNAREIAES